MSTKIKRLRSGAIAVADNVFPLLVFVVLVVALAANVKKLYFSSSSDREPQFLAMQVGPDASGLDEPVAEIVMSAPDKVLVGDLVQVHASESTAKSFKWIITGVKEGNYVIVDNGQRAIIGANAEGEISVTLAAAIADTVDLKAIVIEVVNPNKLLVVPEDSPLRDKIQVIIANINTADKADQQRALSQAFSNVASLIESGVLTDRQKVVDYTSQLTRAAVSANPTEWEPVLIAVEEHVAEVVRRNKLATVQDHVSVWREISNAIQ